MDDIDHLEIEIALRRELVQVQKERDQLQAEIVLLRGALKRLAAPIAYLQAEAERLGHKLDGHWAIAISETPSWYQKEAADALANTPLAAEQAERVKRLEAVAEAARNLVSNYAIPWPHNLRKALDALGQKEGQP